MRLTRGRLATLAAALALALCTAAGGLVATATPGIAQTAEKSSPKAGKGQKVCRYKFPGGERRTWVCKKEEPCCAWDAIKYVKCGSTITGCL